MRSAVDRADEVEPRDVPARGGLSSIVAGAVAGVAGGIVFGLMMQMGGMMPMVAGLAGSTSDGVGWVVHLVIAAVIGAIYGILVGPRGATIGAGWWLGLVYGAIWWVLGPLLIMPSLMGMGPQFGMALQGPMLMSLLGHLLYGLVLGIAYPLIRPRVAM